MDLPTYTSIWRIEKRLYKLYDLRLPMPLPIGQIAVFAGITVPYVVLLTVLGLPFNHTLFWLYVLPPGVLTWLATRPVLENKRLPELLISQLRYLGEPRGWCRMAPLAEKDEVVVTARVWHRATAVKPARGRHAVPQAAPRGVPAAASSWAGKAEPAPRRALAPVRQAAAASPGHLAPAPRPAAASPAAARPAAASPAAARPAAVASAAVASAAVPSRAHAPARPAVSRDAGLPVRGAAAVPSQAQPPPPSAAPSAKLPPMEVAHGGQQDPPAAPRPAKPERGSPPVLPSGPEVTRTAPQERTHLRVVRPGEPAGGVGGSSPQAGAAGGVGGSPPQAGTAPAPSPAPAAPAAPAAFTQPAAPPRAPAGPAAPAQRTPGPPPPVVTQAGSQARALPSVERALSGPAEDRVDGWQHRVRVVPGGLGPGKRDQEAQDKTRARLPLAGPRLIVVLGCTSGAGQTVTALMTGHLLASVREVPVAVLDLNPGSGSLTQQAQGAPAATVGALLAGEVPAGPRPDGLDGAPRGDKALGRHAHPGLEVIASDADPLSVRALDDQDYARIAELLGRHYPLTMVDPAASGVARVLSLADQLILVAPASADAPRSVAMTQEWLDAHGYGDLAARAVTLVNGVSTRSMRDVEQAEAVARGRCRAIVRVPWDDKLSGGAAEPAMLRPQTRLAYTALAGVIIGGLAASTDPRKALR